jgi:hypothetical protein
MAHGIAAAIAFAGAVYLEFVLNLPFVITVAVGVIGLVAFESIYALLKKRHPFR